MKSFYQVFMFYTQWKRDAMSASSKELAIHMRQKHQKMYCGACKMQFSSKEDSLNHVKNIHGIAPNVFE